VPEIASDTSRLQYMHQAECLDLLPSLYGTILVPGGVAEEIAFGRSLGHSLPDLESLGWVQLVTAPQPRVLLLAADLGP